MGERRGRLWLAYLAIVVTIVVVVASTGAPRLRPEKVGSPALFSSPQRFTITDEGYTPARARVMVLLANFSQTANQRVMLGVGEGEDRVLIAEVELAPNQVHLQPIEPLLYDLQNEPLQIEALRGDTEQNMNPAPIAAAMWLGNVAPDDTLQAIGGVAARGAPKVRRKDQILFEAGRVIPFTTAPLAPTYSYNRVALEIRRACGKKCKSARYSLLVSFDGQIIENRELDLSASESPLVIDPIELVAGNETAIGNGAFTLIPIDDKQAKLDLSLSVIPVRMPGVQAGPFALSGAKAGPAPISTAAKIAAQTRVGQEVRRLPPMPKPVAKHKDCVADESGEYSCQPVDGAGPDLCRYNANCWHLRCVAGAAGLCAYEKTPGRGDCDVANGVDSDCPYCGNGRIDPGEDCDDGNRTDDDGCTSDCTRLARCVTNTDCGNPAAPICSSKGYCVQCTSSSHCAAKPETPVCDQSNSCVQCASNSDCSGETPICDQYGACKECTADWQCGTRTPETPACSPLKRCVECTTNRDCAGKPGTPICGRDYRCAARAQ